MPKVPYPTDDWTFEQFVETAKKLTDAGKGTFGYQVNGNWYRDIGWIVGTGKREFDNIIDPNKAQFNTPEIVERMHDDRVRHAAHLEGRAEPGRHVRRQHDQHRQVRHEVRRARGSCRSSTAPSCARRRRKCPSTWCACRRRTASPAGRIAAGARASAIPKTGHGRGGMGVRRVPGGRRRQQAVLHDHGAHPLQPRRWPRAGGCRAPRNCTGSRTAKRSWMPSRKARSTWSAAVPRSKMWSEVVKPTAWDAINNGSAKPAEVFPKVDEKLQRAAQRITGSRCYSGHGGASRVSERRPSVVAGACAFSATPSARCLLHVSEARDPGGPAWPPPRSRSAGYHPAQRREWLEGYLFAAPFLIGFMVFVAFPMLYSIWLMFQRWDLLSPPVFVGFRNIQRAFTDELALKSLSNSAILHDLRRAGAVGHFVHAWPAR